MKTKILIIVVFLLGATLIISGCTEKTTTNTTTADIAITNREINDNGTDVNTNLASDSKEVWVYYYSTEKSTGDPDTSVGCDDIYTDHTIRSVSGTEMQQIEQAFNYLFNPELTTAELNQGLNTRPFDQQTFEIQTITLSEDGILDISFENNDILKNLLGCDGTLFVNTIYPLAHQFDSIKRVRFTNSFDIDI